MVFIQWLDKRAVTLLSTIHAATAAVMVERKVKVDGEWQVQNIRMLQALQSYNEHMGGVDSFDQMASSYRILR